MKSLFSILLLSAFAFGQGITYPVSITVAITPTQGGTGLNSSGSTGIAQVSGGTWSISDILARATTFSVNGAASTPAVTLSGTPVTSGTATTNFPLFYLNSGAAPTSWSTTGTVFGINLPSASTSNFLDFHLNGGASVFNVTSTGQVTTASSYIAPAGGSNGFIINSIGRLANGGGSGIFLLTNSGLTGLTRLDLGLTTSSGPAFCVSGTVITQCLGDGTAGGSFGAGGFTPVGIGTPTQVYNTAATSQTASIGATTMLANGASDRNYRASFYLGQLNAGTSCVGAGTVGVNLLYTDPITGNAYTQVLPIENSGGTALLSALLLTASTPAVANTGWASISFRAKASTNIQFSTTYSAGASCSPGQAYNIYPDLEAL